MDEVSWTHDTNVMVSGFTPLQLMTGNSVTFQGIYCGNEATESMFEDEGVRNIMKMSERSSESVSLEESWKKQEIQEQEDMRI